MDMNSTMRPLSEEKKGENTQMRVVRSPADDYGGNVFLDGLKYILVLLARRVY